MSFYISIILLCFLRITPFQCDNSLIISDIKSVVGHMIIFDHKFIGNFSVQFINRYNKIAKSIPNGFFHKNMLYFVNVVNSTYGIKRITFLNALQSFHYNIISIARIESETSVDLKDICSTSNRVVITTWSDPYICSFQTNIEYSVLNCSLIGVMINGTLLQFYQRHVYTIRCYSDLTQTIYRHYSYYSLNTKADINNQDKKSDTSGPFVFIIPVLTILYIIFIIILVIQIKIRRMSALRVT